MRGSFLAKLRALAVMGSVAACVALVQQASAEPADSKANERPSTVTVCGVEWRTDYNAAYRAAKNHKRMLLINFTPSAGAPAQQSAEQYMAQKNMVDRLQRVERLRVPVDAEIMVNGQSQKLLSFPSFAELAGGPGFVLLDLRHAGQPFYGCPVSLLPYASGKYYHWQNSHLHVMLDLPAGTLTQRSMIFAVRIHPEGPASTHGMHHPTLASGAASHSNYQASIGVQGHHHFESRYHQLSGAAGGSVSEVVAESWPDQNLMDSCIDCVHSWRHSPGHWRGVAGRHRAFGFDIRRGGNGIWYGTGIFAD